MKNVKKAIQTWALMTWSHRLVLPKMDTNANRVAVLAPSNIGSAGDEAMLVALCSALVQRNKEVVVLCAKKGWQARLELYQISVREYVTLRLFRRVTAIFSFRRLIKELQPDEFFVIGADVMDGYYSEVASLMRLTLLELVSRCCKRVRLVGFSFCAQPTAQVCEKFLSVSRLGVEIFSRDPVSQGRLQSLGVPAQLSADLAFLLTPNNDREVFAEYTLAAQECRNKGGQVIALNINAIHVGLEGGVFLDKVVAALAVILSPESLVLLVPHDNRDVCGESDYSLAQKCAERLRGKGFQCLLAPQDILASEAKYLASLADFALSGRMHFAIAAIGQGVPAAMFSYQGKQEGLLQHVGLETEPFIIDYRADLEDMQSALNSAFAVRGQASEKIMTSLSKVKALAESCLGLPEAPSGNPSE